MENTHPNAQDYLQEFKEAKHSQDPNYEQFLKMAIVNQHLLQNLMMVMTAGLTAKPTAQFIAASPQSFPAEQKSPASKPAKKASQKRKTPEEEIAKPPLHYEPFLVPHVIKRIAPSCLISEDDAAYCLSLGLTRGCIDGFNCWGTMTAVSDHKRLQLVISLELVQTLHSIYIDTSKITGSKASQKFSFKEFGRLLRKMIPSEKNPATYTSPQFIRIAETLPLNYIRTLHLLCALENDPKAKPDDKEAALQAVKDRFYVVDADAVIDFFEPNLISVMPHNLSLFQRHEDRGEFRHRNVRVDTSTTHYSHKCNLVYWGKPLENEAKASLNLLAFYELLRSHSFIGDQETPPGEFQPMIAPPKFPAYRFALGFIPYDPNDAAPEPVFVCDSDGDSDSDEITVHQAARALVAGKKPRYLCLPRPIEDDDQAQSGFEKGSQSSDMEV